MFYFITETFIWKSVPEDVYGLYWLRYVFLLNAYIPADNSFWSNLGATWTIPVFFLFYLLIPFLQRFFHSLKKSLVLFVISVILALGIKYLFQGFLKGFMDLPFFILGMLAYYAVKEQEKDLVILGCVAGTLYGQFVDKGWSFAFASVILVLVLYDYQFSNNRIVSVINTLDKYSYGIYLLHCVIMCGIIDKFELPVWLILILSIIGTSVLVFLIHYCYELPIQNWLLRKKKDL